MDPEITIEHAPAITPPAEVATQPHASTRARTVELAATALAIPLAFGAGFGLLTRSRRAGIAMGGLTAAAIAAARWQFQRWFTEEPVHTVERQIGALEIRRYAPTVEAHTRVSTIDFDAALKGGFRRLASYLFGGNVAGEKLEMTTPVITRPRASTHTIAFVMPSGRTLASLPPPHHPEVRLVEQPERRVAVLTFRGRYDSETFQRQLERFHELLGEAQLETTGEPMFAAYDPPTTLPMLRRCELWIELA